MLFSDTQFSSRANLTTDVLLRMSSGLRFLEKYHDPLSEATRMLYFERDMAGFAASQPLITKPDSVFSYSSGTTNILQKIIRHVVGDQAYAMFPHRELFSKIGMRSAVIEPDASGTYVGSSYMYATARDWARFGMLYLQDGVWLGEQVLPKGWVNFTSTPSITTRNEVWKSRYGAQWWLNGGAHSLPDERPRPLIPGDALHCNGFQAQSISVIPSRDCVIVRLGMSHNEQAFSVEQLVAEVLAAIPQ
eukprot:TRINITY_DN2596_c0_g1_i2.p2 TRINITY_DN2596_c0_g1~~TRINITY_DN2596_c0_g1_i2.p2  ORF type:complete len:247 (+),score=30.73 TRINITY_DN2596_c0_g1_i2:894-1634(+)